jgi:hypothetical protein
MVMTLLRFSDVWLISLYNKLLDFLPHQEKAHYDSTKLCSCTAWHINTQKDESIYLK